MGYFIPTKAGQKGPFEFDQIQRFSDQGKLPSTMSLIDADSGLRVKLMDLLSINEQPEELIELEDDFVETSSSPWATEIESAQEEEGTYAASVRSAPRRGSSRSKSRGAVASARGNTHGRRISRGRGTSRRRENLGPEKSVALATILAFFLGPIGLFYSTIKGALIILGIQLFLGFLYFMTIVKTVTSLKPDATSEQIANSAPVTETLLLMLAGFLMTCICTFVGFTAASDHNKRVTSYR